MQVETINSVEEKLDGLADASLDETGGSESFMNPPKKRGRKKGTKNKKTIEKESQSSPDVAPLEDITPLKNVVRPLIHTFDELGVKISETEDARMGAQTIEILVDTGAACINQYLPGMLTQHANLIIFSVTMGQWGVRVYLLRKAKLEELKFQKKMHEEALKTEMKNHVNSDLASH